MEAIISKQYQPKSEIMKKINMDRKLVAAKQSDEEEIKYIAKTYRVPIKNVRAVMKEQGKNGKLCRSRAKIYNALRQIGYEMIAVKSKKKSATKS